jgi:hypothetical protein
MSGGQVPLAAISLVILLRLKTCALMEATGPSEVYPFLINRLSLA